jgi:hypothetical protein
MLVTGVLLIVFGFGMTAVSGQCQEGERFIRQRSDCG